MATTASPFQVTRTRSRAPLSIKVLSPVPNPWTACSFSSSAAQEAQLRQLLDEQQDKSSPNYHKWLTPDDFGRQFGVSDADLQAVTDWLSSQGFTGIKVSAGRLVVEFSGNAQQVRNAFQADIHQYLLNAKTYSANSADPQIPAALGPVVAGIVSLNDFPRRSYLQRLGTFQKSLATGETRPLFTFAGCQAGNCYAVGPADFATIYNTAPLLHASPAIDGTGVTIAIVGETNINVQDVSDFRSMFGLPQNFTAQNIVLNGPDPGVNGSESESDLDVQWSGAVAPGAKIDFVASQPTETTAGIDLSAIYIVDNNLAPIMSESFGACEQVLGTAGNQFYNALWEQAAAQGITVILSSGDGGSAGCDDFNSQQTATQGLAVSGFASTPFNIAVGGTDFDQLSRWGLFWNPNPTSTTPPVPASALSYVPEIPWNDSCARGGISACGSGNLLDIVAGSGGASTIYPKPSFQLGVSGVPNDNHRDLPDVSLFAGNGLTGSFYIMCQRDVTGTGSCSLNSFQFTFQGVGGTSASAPAFAGIMALVVQKTGQRQGNANYTLYSLVKQAGASCNANAATLPAATCTFNDVTKGNNAVPCAGKSPNCSSAVAGVNGVLSITSGTTKIPAYTAGTGYDLAAGLGSFNVQNLVNNWSSVNGIATSTTLNLNNGTAVSVTHGASVPVQIGVTPTASKGDVSLNAQLANGNTLAVGDFTLGSGGSVSGTTSALPGGSNYAVHAHYAGDGTHAPSDSAAVNVTVNPEASATLISLPTFDPATGNETGNAPTSFVYGSPYIMRVDVGNASAHLSFPPQPVCQRSACPTGTVTINDNGSAAPPNGGVFTLNSQGFTEDQPIQFSGGQHTITASYTGDSSFNPSSASYSLTVTPAPTSTIMALTSGFPIVLGGSFPVSIIGFADTLSGVAPTGTIAFFDGTTQLGTAVPVTGRDNLSFLASANLTISSATGSHSVTAVYSGDANYATSTSEPASISVFYPTITTISFSPASVIYPGQITLTATTDTSIPFSNVTLKPTGQVNFFAPAEGAIAGATTNAISDANGNWELQSSVTFTPSTSEFFTVRYAGDSNFAPSSANSSFVIVTVPDFSLPPNTPVTIVAGQSQTFTVNVTPLSSAPSTVSLRPSGMPTGMTMAFNPSSVNLNGQPVPVMVTIATTGPSGGPSGSAIRRFAFVPRLSASFWTPLSALCCFLSLLFVAVSWRRKRYSGISLATLAVVISLILGCGGGSSFTGGGGDNGGRVPSTITLTSANAKVPAYSTYTMTAKVTSSKSPTGTVNIFEGQPPQEATIVPPASLVNGQAVFTLVGFNPGTYPFWANYGGDSRNQASQTTTLVQQVFTGTVTLDYVGRTANVQHSGTITLTLQ